MGEVKDMERNGLLKIEGENRIDIESIVDSLADRYEVSDKTALKWFCTAIQYNLVEQQIIEQIDYLLEENVLKK